MTAKRRESGCPTPWCTDRGGEHHPQDCSTDSYTVHGLNVGTSASAWVSCESSGEDRPVAVIELGKRVIESATSVYMDQDGLRQFAHDLCKLADILDEGLVYVLSGERR